jgi:CpcD/allophycocyanin linker domain
MDAGSANHSLKTNSFLIGWTAIQLAARAVAGISKLKQLTEGGLAIMTITSNAANLSDYSSRMLTLHVTGMGQDSRRGTYAMTIPHRCLSQTMQGIHRRGGKVIGVNLSSAETAAAKSVAAEPPAPKPSSKRKSS